MDAGKLQIRTLDKKISSIKPLVPVIPARQSWIKTIREALGMSARQLAAKIGVSQARVAYMEKNERNLKISTLEKIAKSMDCAFVPLFIPNESLEAIVQNQAERKASQMLRSVNQNMALENQLSDSSEILSDMTQELLSGSRKKIWD